MEERKHGEVRPGGRTEKVRQMVAKVVLGFLEEGKTQFTLSEVATEAGIHRSTLYRRWKNQEELIQEALSLHASKIDIPNSGNWKEDIHLLVKSLAVFAADPVEQAIYRAMINPDNPGLTAKMIEYWQPLMEEQASPIRRAQERGEVCKELDPQNVLTLIISPLLMHSLVIGGIASAQYRDDLTNMIIRLCEMR